MVHVRGHKGYTIDPPKDAVGASGEIQWVESNAVVRATFRGTSLAQAIAVLNAFQPRDADLTHGFDPRSSPTGYGLLGEHAVPGSARSTDAVFEYAHDGTGSGNTADLEISTYTFKSYPGYLRTWIGGQRGANGAVVEADPSGRYRSVLVSWPDESLAVVKSTNLDIPTLERIARSIQPLSRNQAAHLASTRSHTTLGTPDRRIDAIRNGKGRTTPRRQPIRALPPQSQARSRMPQQRRAAVRR